MAGVNDATFQWLTRRARADKFFLGQSLALYQSLHRMSDKRLAKLLECSAEALGRLALCRRPDDQGARFREDVERVAVFASCSSERLLQLLREVAAITSLREAGVKASADGMLMAARDRTNRNTTSEKRRSKQDRKK